MARRPVPPNSSRPAPEGASPAGSGRDLHRWIADEVRRRIAAAPGGHLVNGRLEPLELRLSVRPADPEAGAAGLARDLEDALARYVEEAVESAASFRPGRTYCHRCESADCPHAAPPGARQVFAGYSPTGTPRWMDFGQLCLEHRHPLVDRLYDEERPATLVLLQDGPALRADLLPGFRSSLRRHEVAGQVATGLFSASGGAPDRRFAVAFQAVVRRRRRGGSQVGLNLLGGDPEIRVSSRGGLDPPWRGALLWGQARCAAVSRAARGGRLRDEALGGRVEGILRGLAGRIERDLRGRGRRTLHAEQRHRSGGRPTRKALDDLRAARPEAILVDARHATLVVLGDKGRAHFFAPEGRLVSSVHYPRDGIGKKRRIGAWRPARPEEIAALRRRVEESTRPTGDEETTTP